MPPDETEKLRQMSESFGLDPMLLLGIALIVGFFLIMLRFRPKPTLYLDRRDFAYEYVVEPADKASPDFSAKFGTVEAGGGGRIYLMRIGFFNRGREAVQPNDFLKPMACEFPPTAEILRAEFAESVKHKGDPPERPRIDHSKVVFPPFALDSLGALIFNIVVEGADGPEQVEGAIEGQDGVPRLD